MEANRGNCEAPAYVGTDFIIARDGRVAGVYLFFDKLPCAAVQFTDQLPKMVRFASLPVGSSHNVRRGRIRVPKLSALASCPLLRALASTARFSQVPIKKDDGNVQSDGSNGFARGQSQMSLSFFASDLATFVGGTDAQQPSELAANGRIHLALIQGPLETGG